jgi:hypothetical protein
MDNLEKFVRENRKQLDRYKPDITVWYKIKASLKGVRSFYPGILFKAAIVIVVLGTAFILYRKGTDKLTSEINIYGNSELYLNEPQLKETEIYYNTLINNLYREATPLLTGNPEIEYELKSDFSVLDSLCSDIKSDLKDNIANQEVIEALIRNYRAKIQILEEMLIILGENKDSTKNIQGNEL